MKQTTSKQLEPTLLLQLFFRVKKKKEKKEKKRAR